MSDDLDLAAIDQRHEPDPEFRAALGRRVAAILDGREPIDTADAMDDVRTLNLETTQGPPAPPRHDWAVRIAIVAAAVVLVLLGALVLAARDEASEPQGPVAPPGVPTAASGLIAFVGSTREGEAESDSEIDPDSDTEIFVVAPDGTGLRALTSTPGVAEVGPAWSPDGTRLAFVRRAWTGDETHEELVVIDPATGDETFSTDIPAKLTFHGDRVVPPVVWSPDGRLIFLSVGNNGNGQIVDLETTTSTTIHRQSAGWSPMGWSPDGRWFVFGTCCREPGAASGELVLVPAGLVGTTDLDPDDVANLPGVRQVPLQYGPEGLHMSWMPDSSAVAITSGKRTVEEGYFGQPVTHWTDVVTIADGQRHPLLDSGVDGGFAPSWSPDGRHLTYLTCPGNDPLLNAPVPADAASVDPTLPGALVWVAAPDGTDAHPVATSWSAPIWSPGGTLLVVIGEDGLFTVRRDGAGITRLTQHVIPGNVQGGCDGWSTQEYGPVWQPVPPSAAAAELANTVPPAVSATTTPITSDAVETRASATTQASATTDG